MPKKKKVLYPIGKVNKSESGLQMANWTYLGEGQYNPDELGIDVYKQMMKDAEVRAAFNLIKLATLSRDWKIVYSETSKNSEEIVKYLRYAFEHMEGRIDGGLSGLLYAIPYGFSVTEIVYKLFNEGPYKGKVGLKKLKDLDPETISFVTDKYGNLKKVYQYPSGAYGDIGYVKEGRISLPIDKLIIYTNEKEFGNYYGTPRLRCIYKNWFIKDVVTKFWNIALERFGMPMLMGKVPSAKDLSEMSNILNNAQAKSTISYVDGWEISALETGIGRSSGGDYLDCLKYHNSQISRGMLVPGTLMGDDAGGSFAKAKVGFDVFQLMLKNLEADLSGIVEQYLIKPLLNYNYGELQEYPQFVFEPLTRAEFLELAKVFALLVRNGVVGAEETWIRDMMRVPKISETAVSRNTRKISDTEKTKNPPPETRIIKTENENKNKPIVSDKNKRTVRKPTQQVKTPK